MSNIFSTMYLCIAKKFAEDLLNEGQLSFIREVNGMYEVVYWQGA